MLWKYKKCYQETNEDVLEIKCVKLINIVAKDIFNIEVFYQYIPCGSADIITSSFINDTGILNICINSGSLVILSNDSFTVTTEENCTEG